MKKLEIVRSWGDKLDPPKKITLSERWEQMLEDGRTARERDLEPFWDEEMEDEYSKWWLPRKGFDREKEKLETGNSWFKAVKETEFFGTGREKLSLPKATFSEISDDELSEKREILARRGKSKNNSLKTLRIRIFPTEKEAEKLMKMHDQSRWFYNACRDIVYNHHPELLTQKSVSETKLRDLIGEYSYSEKTVEYGDNEGEEFTVKGFVREKSPQKWPVALGDDLIHCHIPRGAIYSFARALNAAISHLRSGNIQKFEMKYKSKKSMANYTTLFEDSNFPKALLHMKSKYCYTTNRNGKNTRTYTTFKEIFRSDSRPSGLVLEYDKLKNKHYILYSVPIGWYPSDDRRISRIDSENQAIKSEVIAIDPGVRTFLTGYDPEGSIYTVGKGANLTLAKTLDEAEFYAEFDRKKSLNLHRKITNRVRDLHWKMSKFLCSYEAIIFPDFRIAEMLKSRKLNRKTKAQMQMLSFFTFKQRLEHQCRKYSSKLIMCTEEYTSKTCGACGTLNKRLGGSKLFQCPCGMKLDRDENAARNILLKQIKALNWYASQH